MLNVYNVVSFTMVLRRHDVYSGQFIWRIRNYSEVLDRARRGIAPVIYSQVFLTHRHGYKLAIAFAPFGESDGYSFFFRKLLINSGIF